METPHIRIEASGAVLPLDRDVTTVGRGRHVDVRLADPTVSRLHAEIVRRGPYAYVLDLGLSRNGTRVNGRLVAQRLLADGDVLTFGAARCRVSGLLAEDCSAEDDMRRAAAPELTRRELDVVSSLCRPALSEEAFVAPASARDIANDLVVTEAAVKQHLLRLYQKFRIPEGANRRVRLANEVIALGLVRPLPQAHGGGPALTARWSSTPAARPEPGAPPARAAGTPAAPPVPPVPPPRSGAAPAARPTPAAPIVPAAARADGARRPAVRPDDRPPSPGPAAGLAGSGPGRR